MAYVNVLSGLASSLAALPKIRPGKNKNANSNTKIDNVASTMENVQTYLQHFAVEQSNFASQTTAKLNKIEKNIEYITKRISPKIFTIGKGKNEQSVKYDPLAPEGRQVTVLTGSGKSGRLASKKGGATSEYNQALSKAAYSSNSESDSTPISVKPKMTAAGSTKEERAALYKKLSYETREDDPVYLLKVSMEENFKKVFEKLDELNESINSVDSGGGIDLDFRRRRNRGSRKPFPRRRKPTGRIGKGWEKIKNVLKKSGRVFRVAGKLAIPLTVAMAAWDAAKGFRDANKILDLEENRAATFGEKLSAAAGSVISGLTLGAVDEKNAAKTIAEITGAGDKTSTAKPIPAINTTQQTTAPQTTAAAPLPQKTAESMELINAPPGTPGAVPEEFIGGMGKDLSKYIVKEQASVNIDGLNPMLKDRMAAMAKEYYDLTKRKIQVNSGFRTYQQQAALYKKFGKGKAAPPGHSRHESGLAIDINSSDGNRLAALGLLKKYGFVRPVSNEAWHVEPKETAKRGGGIPDNPYNPGQPIAVPDKNGNAVSPDTGKKLSESQLDKTVKNNIDLSAVNAPAASSVTPTPTISPSPADSAVLTSTETNTGVMPAATAAIQEISSIPPTPAVATATAAAPSQVASGSSISQQSATLEQNKLAAAVQPVINNVIPMAPPVQCRFQPQKPANLPEASIDNGDTTIKTMFARDRWA